MPRLKKYLSDSDCLREAEGWLELGNAAEALKELSYLSSRGASTVGAFRVRYSAFAMSEQWDHALFLSEVAVDIFPSAPEVWVWRAHAIRVLSQSAQKARDALVPAGQKFPQDTVILLNLALYEAELGETDKAVGWLAEIRKAAMASKTTSAVSRLIADIEPLRALWRSVEAAPA